MTIIPTTQNQTPKTKSKIKRTMNKKIIIPALALASLLTACDDDYMKQFEDQEANITDVKNLNMVLENGDYSSIASNPKNIAKALEMDPETESYVEKLKAVGKQYYFTEDISADEYIPAFLDAKYPNADLGSVFTVTYKQYQAPAAYLADFASLTSYQLNEEDYKGVWGDKMVVKYLTPQTTSKIPGILKEGVSGAQKGAMCVVNYAYSDVEPSIGGASPAEPVSPYKKISEVLAAGAGVESVIKAEVIGVYSKGMLVSDGTASILVYPNAVPNYNMGDSVIVAGTPSMYGGLLQFPNSSEINRAGHNSDFKLGEAKVMDAAALNAWMGSPEVKYATIKGKLKISGNYYNVEIEGLNGQGSISYPMAGTVPADLNGKEIEATGYLIGVTGSSTKYANMMLCSISEAGAEATTPVGVIATSAAGTYKAKGVVVEKYSRGFLLSDGTGKILVYNSKGYDVEPGAIVTVEGKTSAYAGLMQFGTPTVTAAETTAKVTQPAPMELTGEDFTEYVADPYCAYVTYTGTLTISGNYLNVAIDGTTVQGSIQYALDGMVNADLNGKKVVVTGYAIGQASSGKYLNTMATSVVEATAPAAAKATFRAAAVLPTAAALYQFDGTNWVAYSNNDAQVAVLSQKDYNELGAATVGEPATALPIYLAKKFPYLVDDAKVVVVYTNSKNALVAEDWAISKGVWAPVKNYITETLSFTKEADGINANMSTFFESTFLGVDGGFVAQNVAMSGSLTYVWSNTTQYGWKGSAYANKVNNPAESWLVSPAINLKKAKDPVLTFDEVYQYVSSGAPADYLKVMISTNYNGDVTAASWTELTIPTWSTGSDWNFVNTGLIDLDAFKGNSVVIAFIYKSTDTVAPTWEIKNFKVIERPDTDNQVSE